MSKFDAPPAPNMKAYSDSIEREYLSKLRDEFAAKAMQFFTFSDGCIKQCANRCYEIADAMLEARSK